jgi:hypothetical protein
MRAGAFKFKARQGLSELAYAEQAAEPA